MLCLCAVRICDCVGLLVEIVNLDMVRWLLITCTLFWFASTPMLCLCAVILLVIFAHSTPLLPFEGKSKSNDKDCVEEQKVSDS